MSRYDKSKLKQLAEEMAEHAKALAPAPQRRVIVPDDFAPERPCTTEIMWLCDQIRLYETAYGLSWLVKQETRGYAGLESMPDDELKRVYRTLGRAIDCRNSGIPFEDTDLISYDQGYDDPC